MTQASRVSSPGTSVCHKQTHSEFEDAGSGHDNCGASVAGFCSHASYSENARIDDNTAECSGSASNLHGRGFIDTTALGQLCSFISQNQAPMKNIIPSEGPMYGASQTPGNAFLYFSCSYFMTFHCIICHQFY